jgi:hypothetical protein
MEGPQPEDTDRLIGHLGLVWFDRLYPPHSEPFKEARTQPGIACYDLHAIRMAHWVYQPDLRQTMDLSGPYLSFDPELFRVIADLRQPPHRAYLTC